MKDHIQDATDILTGTKMLLGIKITVGYTALRLFEVYLFNDWKFIGFLAVLVAIDTATGVWKHWKKGTVTSIGFGRTITKLVIYAAFLILTHVLASFTVKGEPNVILSWFPEVAYTMLIVREALSIIENMNEIMPGIIPAWITDRLKATQK